MHGPTVEDVHRGNLVEALLDIQAQGMTRWVGISTRLPHLPAFVKMGVFDVFQIPCSPLDPTHRQWVTAAAEAGAGVIVRGGIARGGPDADRVSPFSARVWQAAKLDELVGEITAAEMLLRYTLTNPHCHTALVGTLNADHVTANAAAAAQGPLSADLHAEITRRVAAAAV